jgi:very-short-patch-repair endonuclease
VWEVGADVAAIDGVSALLYAGLEGFADDAVHVSVLHWHRTPHPPGTRVHKVIRRTPDELPRVGLPRVRPALAAVRAAQWAASDRQAALVLAMTVQQRLTTPARLARAHVECPGRARRAFIGQVIRDLTAGSQSLGELDFAALCRRRGLPEPDRQVVRTGPRGRVYLDVRWAGLGLVVEIDGAQHRLGLALTEDNLRQNDVALDGDMVLRIDLLGLRVARDRFLDQVERAMAQLAHRATA